MFTFLMIFFVLEHSEGWHKTSCEALNNIPLEPTYNTIPMPYLSTYLCVNFVNQVGTTKVEEFSGLFCNMGSSWFFSRVTLIMGISNEGCIFKQY